MHPNRESNQRPSAEVKSNQTKLNQPKPIKPKTTQPDIEPDTSNLDDTTDDMYDMRSLKHSTLDDHEYNVKIKYDQIYIIC